MICRWVAARPKSCARCRPSRPATCAAPTGTRASRSPPEEAPMHRSWTSTLALIVALTLVPIAGCHREGPAEETGRKIDETIDKLKHPGEGPLEKTGRKIDEAVDDAKD